VGVRLVVMVVVVVMLLLLAWFVANLKNVVSKRKKT